MGVGMSTTTSGTGVAGEARPMMFVGEVVLKSVVIEVLVTGEEGSSR